MRGAGAAGAPIPAVKMRFADGAGVRVSGGVLRAASGVSLAAVQAALARHGATDLRPQHALPEAALEALDRAALARDGRSPGLASWHRAALPSAEAAAELAASLNALDVVDTAYVAQAPVPVSLPAPPAWRSLAFFTFAASATPDHTSRQEYLNAAPVGIDARYAWTLPGGRGQGITVANLDYDWLLSHEDLQLDSATTHLGGVTYPYDGKDHGTAVLGMLVARDNGYGVTGIVSAATTRVVGPTFNGQFNAAAAVSLAASRLRAGDVMVIALAYNGPLGKHVPIEWDPADFDAIRAATAAGITIVEAAGNQEQNLDDPALGGWFDRAHDSGAIIVGASDGRPYRYPANFTTYGSRVDLQGWGYGVTTTGYGDAWLGTTAPPEALYTSSFNGTSAAAPMVAGAAAALQGRLKAAGRAVLSPTALRALLVRSGTPQAASTLTWRRIGPFPNLRAAVALAPGGSGNAPPVIYMPHSSYQGSEGSTITVYNYEALDPDGDNPLTLRWTFSDGSSAVGEKATKSYPDQGTFPLRFTATDARGAVTTWTGNIVVNNARPYGNAGRDTTIPSGGQYRFRGTFTDKGVNDAPWRYSVSFGDGTPAVTGTFTSQTQAALVTHSYAKDSTYRVRFKVYDKDNLGTSDDAIVHVGGNAAPTAVITGGPFTGVEGTAIAMSAAASSDPEGRPLTYAWSFSDGGGFSQPTISKVFGDNGVYSVRLIVTDDWGVKDTATTTATIANVAPTATLTAPTSIYEGSGYMVQMAAEDPSVLDEVKLTYALDCGLGAGYTAFGIAYSIQCPVQLDERATVTVRGKVRDKDGGERAYSRTMTVKNAAPAVRLRLLSATGTEVTTRTVKVGTTVTFRGRFSDQGVNDAPWSYAMHWADGTPLEAGQPLAPGVTVTRTHRYDVVGTWKSYMTVRDVDGGVGKSLLMTVTVVPCPTRQATEIRR